MYGYKLLLHAPPEFTLYIITPCLHITVDLLHSYLHIQLQYRSNYPHTSILNTNTYAVSVYTLFGQSCVGEIVLCGYRWIYLMTSDNSSCLSLSLQLISSRKFEEEAGCLSWDTLQRLCCLFEQQKMIPFRQKLIGGSEIVNGTVHVFRSACPTLLAWPGTSCHFRRFPKANSVLLYATVRDQGSKKGQRDEGMTQKNCKEQSDVN